MDPCLAAKVIGIRPVETDSMFYKLPEEAEVQGYNKPLVHKTSNIKAESEDLGYT